MNRRTRIALVATPLIAALFYVALNWWVLEESPVWVRAGPEARANRYLAFERLLDRMGARKQVIATPAELSKMPPGATLLLAAHRLAYMTPPTVSALAKWVDRGGHLVVQAERLQTRDPLLDAFDIDRKEPKPDPKAKAPANAPPSRRVPEQFMEAVLEAEATPVTFPWPGASAPLHVELPASTRLIDDDDREAIASVSVNRRTIVLSVASGKGTVTVVPSFGFLANPNVGKLDHAEFGWLLATGGAAAPQVLLFLRFESMPLGDWIWREAWTVVIAFALFLVLWLARVMPRFGPLAPDIPPERRSLAEHILASGRFLWSRKQRRYLVAAVRERALRFARARGLTEGEIPAVGGNVDTAPAFIAAISRLSSIETRLARRGPPTKTAEDKKP